MDIVVREWKPTCELSYREESTHIAENMFRNEKILQQKWERKISNLESEYEWRDIEVRL